jgi:hypothetical protein
MQGWSLNLPRARKSGGSVIFWVRPIVGLLVMLCLMLESSPVSAQSEDQIKAAYLLHFARYVEWPESAFSSRKSPVQICMLESDGFHSVVASTVVDKIVGSRSVEVVIVENAATATSCHILFVGDLGKESLEEVLTSLGDASVFSVGNDPDFARRGGVANFFRASNKIRFAINRGAASSAGLKISSRLLRLAKLVESN